MPKVSDLKAYYREIISKAGLDEEKARQVLGLFDDDKVAKAFTDGFKPLPDYSHDLDDVRNRTKAEVTKTYDDWQKEELEKYNQYLAGINKLKAYEAKYGSLDDQQSQDFLNKDRGGKTMLTKEDIDVIRAEMKKEQDETFARRDTAVLELLDVRESHMNTFKKSLDVKAFEAAWKEHPEWGGTIKQAYREYVNPEMEKIQKAQFEEELKRKYDEGLRDGFSRKGVPSDSQPKSFSPMFDKDVKIEKMNETEQEQHSRASFFEGLIEKQPA